MADVMIETAEAVEGRLMNARNPAPSEGRDASHEASAVAVARQAFAMDEEVEGRVVYVSDRPISFETFLELSHNTNTDLVNGVMVKQMAAQLQHERLFMWLAWLLNGYVQKKGIGIVLGSRSAVRIDNYNGRLPDLLFVRRERMDIVQQKAIFGTPDLVVEIVSPGDRPSHAIELETDYVRIEVPEIWFIDPRRRRVRALRKRDDDYEETILTMGTLASEAVDGFALQVEWLFQNPLPNEFDTLMTML